VKTLTECDSRLFSIDCQIADCERMIAAQSARLRRQVVCGKAPGESSFVLVGLQQSLLALKEIRRLSANEKLPRCGRHTAA
jgi:hypothetical protein